jgi:hypothetical protein
VTLKSVNISWAWLGPVLLTLCAAAIIEGLAQQREDHTQIVLLKAQNLALESRMADVILTLRATDGKIENVNSKLNQIGEQWVLAFGPPRPSKGSLFTPR